MQIYVMNYATGFPKVKGNMLKLERNQYMFFSELQIESKT